MFQGRGSFFGYMKEALINAVLSYFSHRGFVRGRGAFFPFARGVGFVADPGVVACYQAFLSPLRLLLLNAACHTNPEGRRFVPEPKRPKETLFLLQKHNYFTKPLDKASDTPYIDAYI